MDQAHGPIDEAPAGRVATSTPTFAQIAPWAIAFVCVALFLYVFKSVLFPFAAGIALGYLLDPIAEKLERIGFNRLGAALFILAVFLVVLVLALVLVVPILGRGGNKQKYSRKVPETR